MAKKKTVKKRITKCTPPDGVHYIIPSSSKGNRPDIFLDQAIQDVRHLIDSSGECGTIGYVILKNKALESLSILAQVVKEA